MFQIAKYHILNSRAHQSTAFPPQLSKPLILSICVQTGVDLPTITTLWTPFFFKPLNFPLCYFTWNCPIYWIFCLPFPAIPWNDVTWMAFFMAAPLNQIEISWSLGLTYISMHFSSVFGVYGNPGRVSIKVLWVWTKISCVKYICNDGSTGQGLKSVELLCVINYKQSITKINWAVPIVALILSSPEIQQHQKQSQKQRGIQVLQNISGSWFEWRVGHLILTLKTSVSILSPANTTHWCLVTMTKIFLSP